MYPEFLKEIEDPKKCQELANTQGNDFLDCLDQSSLECFRRAYVVGKVSGWEPVLINGDNGVGKSGFAKLIWNVNSYNTKHKGCLEVNCAAIPENLVEAELFGYAPGAFTGGSKNGRPGKIAEAQQNYGCLFLDEFGELPLVIQAKLLRFFQDGKIQCLGKEEEIVINNLKVICATNRNLEKEIDEKRFRIDLFNRVNKFHIVVPPLKDRPNDCFQNAQNFLAKFKKNLPENSDWANDLEIDPEFDKDNRDSKYSWPGNFRELQNRLYQAIIRNVIRNKPGSNMIHFYDLLTKEDVVRELKKENGDLEDVGNDVLSECGFSPLNENLKKFDLEKSLKKLKKMYINYAILHTETRTEAAKMLGFKSYQTMDNQLKEK